MLIMSIRSVAGTWDKIVRSAAALEDGNVVEPSRQAGEAWHDRWA